MILTIIHPNKVDNGFSIVANYVALCLAKNMHISPLAKCGALTGTQIIKIKGVFAPFYIF